ncbi:MAG: GIY-YIG nuclease family protein [Candidatus Brocadiia bacterium]
MAFQVYVLVNPDGETYVGQTSDLPRRLQQHNDPACDLTLHTQRHTGPWRLLYSEQCKSRRTAMRRERQLKSGGGRRFILKLLREEGGC